MREMNATHTSLIFVRKHRAPNGALRHTAAEIFNGGLTALG